jgi:hypothetical protein
MNHVATGRALGLKENYSLLIMGVSNGDEDDGGVDGDGSGGNSPSWQGAGTETSVARNWSSMAAVLWNFSWMDADYFRVFASEGIYRRKGDVRGHPGGPHHLVVRQGVTHTTLWCGQPLALLRLCFGLRLRVGKNRRFGFRFVQFREYFLCNFLKHKNSRKQELAV